MINFAIQNRGLKILRRNRGGRIEKKRLKNNARSKSSKHWLKRLDIYINLDRELLNS